MSRRFAIFWILATLAGPSRGEPPGPPRILGVDPPGGSVGREETWSIAGTNLLAVERILISGTGVEVLAFERVDEGEARARVRVSPDAPTGFREVRLDGPSGVSNPAIVRIDTLPQVAEADRGGDPSRAQDVAEGTTVVGRFEPGDADLYRIVGTPGRGLSLDLEACRVGIALAPVLTVLPGSGTSPAEARPALGGDGDGRLGTIVPPGGSFLVQVRDNTYRGAERGRYRLRVDPRPFASAWFPLGGPRGSTVDVEVSGGSLSGPLHKAIALPDLVGATVEVGPIDTPEGPILAPGHLVAGEGPESFEPPDRPAGTTTELTPGRSLNGRIARAGEIDAYRYSVRAGDRIVSKIEASALGSRLDPVLVLKDRSGRTLAEVDDMEPSKGLPASPDGVLVFEAKADETLTIEVSDRFGRGGPEFGYRLRVGSPRDDFSVTLLAGASRLDRAGAINLEPGTSASIDFVVLPGGTPGPIEVRVEGLPAGASAEPVEVRPGRTPRSLSDSLRLKVRRDAAPGLAELRVVGSARSARGGEIVREATVRFEVASSGDPDRPATRLATRIPLRILGSTGSPR